MRIHVLEETLGGVRVTHARNSRSSNASYSTAATDASSSTVRSICRAIISSRHHWLRALKLWQLCKETTAVLATAVAVVPFISTSH
jgi:hypothetical protein